MTDPTEPTVRGKTPPRVVHTIIDIAAPPDRVFDALTGVRELATWWGGDEARILDCEADVRPGGAWHVRTIDRDGAERTFGGEYRVVDPPHRLEQTWRSSEDGEPSSVRYDLEPLEVDGEDGTRLTVTHSEAFAMAMGVVAKHVFEVRATLIVRHQVEPAWFGAPHRVAWARRILR